MTGENYFFFIDINNNLNTVTMLPVETYGGKDSYFSNRGIDKYWEVSHDDVQSKLKAITEAVEQGVNPESALKRIAIESISYEDVKTFADNNDIPIKEIGDRYEIGDGKVTATGSSALTALLNYYTPDVSIDTSNDPEDELDIKE